MSRPTSIKHDLEWSKAKVHLSFVEDYDGDNQPYGPWHFSHSSIISEDQPIQDLMLQYSQGGSYLAGVFYELGKPDIWTTSPIEL